MDWRARLAEWRDIHSIRPVRVLPKLTKVDSDSFGSTSHRRNKNSAAVVVPLRTRMLAAADAVCADPKLIFRLPAADVAACVGMSDGALRAHVRALEDKAERMAGRVPNEETAVILCARCGPVWAPPKVARALPQVRGIPRAIGCSWCHVRKRGKSIPRPPLSTIQRLENLKNKGRDGL